MHYIGPLTWHNTLPAPACLDLLDKSKPTAYFALGSESLDELVVQLGELARDRVQIVVATGAAKVADLKVPEGVFLEQYINTDALLPHCDLVCCHGGNGTLYQALGFGLPCVVVATHAEQHYGGKRIGQLGLGINLTLKHLQRKGIGDLIEAVQHILITPAYRERAKAFSQHILNLNSAIHAADVIESILQ
jgi:UDP:flavonoid glycosyltransferase YjiC (YdhE family)